MEQNSKQAPFVNMPEVKFFIYISTFLSSKIKQSDFYYHGTQGDMRSLRAPPQTHRDALAGFKLLREMHLSDTMRTSTRQVSVSALECATRHTFAKLGFISCCD